jgi:hypothetical protein
MPDWAFITIGARLGDGVVDWDGATLLDTDGSAPLDSVAVGDAVWEALDVNVAVGLAADEGLELAVQVGVAGGGTTITERSIVEVSGAVNRRTHGVTALLGDAASTMYRYDSTVALDGTVVTNRR